MKDEKFVSRTLYTLEIINLKEIKKKFSIQFRKKSGLLELTVLIQYYMSTIRITKQFSFETGHALYGYDGKCKNVHGHSYKLSVTVSGKPIDDNTNVKFGMVIDFGDLKKIVNEEVVDLFDHATVFNKNTPHIELAKELKDRGHHVILVDYQPTSEMMVIDFAAKIKARLPDNIKLHAIKLQETDTSFAEWFAHEN